MDKFISNVKLLVYLELFLKFKSILIIPLLTKYYGANGYGQWSQVLLLVGFLSPLIITGIDSAFIRFVSGRTVAVIYAIYKLWLKYTVIIFAILSLILLASKNFVASLLFESNDIFIYLALCVVIGQILVNTVRNYYRVLNDAKTMSIISIIQAFSLIGSSIVVYVYNFKIEILILLIAINDILIFYYYHYKLNSKSIRKINLPLKFLKKYIYFGIQLIPAGYAMWILNASDRIILSRYVTISNIGVYFFAYSLGYLIVSFVINPIWTMFPNLATSYYNNSQQSKIIELFNISTSMIFIFSFPAIVFVSLVSKDIILLLSTPEFLMAQDIFIFVFIGYFFHILASYHETIITFEKKPIVVTFSIIVAAVLNIVLNIILIPTYGILGAAVATMIAFFVQYLITLVLSNSIIKLKYDYRTLAITVIVSIGALFIPNEIVDNNFLNILLIGIMLLVYYGILYYITLKDKFIFFLRLKEIK